MNSTRWILFVFFFVSGFCSLVYQVIWTRLAFASFGIITPVLSVVLSVFMLGLAVGSWAGGRLALPLVKRTGLSAIIFYGAAELIIGLSAYLVPKLFSIGENFLLSAGESDSFRYLILSAVVLAVSIFPWCFFMGSTFPLMMTYVREQRQSSQNSFSYLYLANVLGAMSGAILTALILIELFGFHQTLRIAATANFGIALVALFLGLKQNRLKLAPAGSDSTSDTNSQAVSGTDGRFIKWILFSTGFCAMAMEVIWTRAFTPILKTQVYSFAMVIFIYLGATFLGSAWYRRHLKKDSVLPMAKLLGFLAGSAFFPILLNDPRFIKMDWMFTMHAVSAAIVLISICPFCFFLGYLTPGLIDEISGGNPSLAGKLYAINVLGCILGPIMASYILLPWVSERFALILLGLPFLIFYFWRWKSLKVLTRSMIGIAVVIAAIFSTFFSKDFQNFLSNNAGEIKVRRDYAASVASGISGKKILLVNGIGMTHLTPITKFMVDLPMAFHREPPRSVLVICFGMGTTYRSALAWGANATVVELIPDVPKAFLYYHSDANEVLKNPRGRIVIDDGRRFLNRVKEKYDVIVIDPPPPIEAAGSSLLYSKEFYETVKEHLNPGGILQAWFPGGDEFTSKAFIRTVYDSFGYTRCFPSVEKWGFHMLASQEPIESRTPSQLIARFPSAAKKDLLEWADTTDASEYFSRVVSHPIPSELIIANASPVQITDDDPLNEYFLLRRMRLF